jgi:hypothetical protein
MTIGSRSVPDTDLTGIRLVRFVTGYRPSDSSPLPTAWRVEAVMRSGPALVCASGDHEAMLSILLWAGQELAKTPNRSS